MRKFVLTLALATPLALIGCSPTTGNVYTDARYAGQTHVCNNLGQVAANTSWTWMAEGKSLTAVLDAFDSYYATKTTSADVQAARDIRWATRVIYTHPDWTQSQAALGVTQACLRSSLY